MISTNFKKLLFILFAALLMCCAARPSCAKTVTVCDIVVPPGEECPPGHSSTLEVNDRGRATTGASRKCTPLPIRLANIMTCPLCPLFEIILETDQNMATKSFSALATGFRNLIIIVMALYIALQTLLNVSAFTKQDAPKYLGNLMKQGFKVLVAALLLSNSDWIYQYVINPLMSAGLEFGVALLFDQRLSSAFQVGSGSNGFSNGVISQELLDMVMTAIRMFNQKAAQLPAIGSALICISTHAAAKYGVLPDFSMFIEGALLWVFGWAILLAAGFYLLDSVVRFGIFCTLLPFLIASWPFKVTQQYVKTGWNIFMNSFFNFVMMGLIISVITELIGQAMTAGEGGFDALISAINGDKVDDLKEMMDISGASFLVLIACCLFSFKMVGQINALATDIAGGGGSQSIGGKIGGTAAQAATGVAKAGGRAGKAVGGFMYEASHAKDAVRNVKQGIARGLGKVGSKFGWGRRANPNGSGGGGNP